MKTVSEEYPSRHHESLPGLGDPPTAEEVAGAVRRNHERLWRFREQPYGRALPYREAARRLGVSTNQITNLLRAGDLLALDGPDGPRLPSWQFDPDTRRGRLEGIRHDAAVFCGRVLGLSAWMTTPSQTLGGRTPADAHDLTDAQTYAALGADPALCDDRVPDACAHTQRCARHLHPCPRC